MKKIYIAPIAGVTDYTFRGILEDFNPDLIFTEMVSVNALSVLNDKTISKILKLRDGNAVQIFGEDIEKIKSSAQYIQNLGVKHINLNCGCPMKKIVNCGYGAALVREPEKIKRILSEIKSVLNDDVKLSVKIRIGYKEPENYVQIGKIAEEVGCDHITVHGRTREQLYSGKADWNAIKTLKNHVPIKVVGNGDVCSVEDYVRMKEETGADAVAIGRHSLGNPFIFKQIKDYNLTKKYSSPTLEEVIDTIKRHYKLELEFKPERIAIREMRKNILWYLKGFKDSNKVKNTINTLTDINEIFDVLNEYKNNFN